MYHLSQLQSEGNVSEGERLERHCFLKKKNKEGSEPRNEATWETRKSWEKSSAQRLQKNTALWTLGCWPMETLFRLLANRTVEEKSELSLCQAPLSMGFSGENNGMGCYPLLQGIFLTQGLNPHLLHALHWQAGSLQLGQLGKPRISRCYYHR